MFYLLNRIISDKDVVRLIKKWRQDPIAFLKEDAESSPESFKALTENLEIGIEVLFKEVTEANKEHRYPEVLEAREQIRKNSQKYSFDYIQRMLTRQSEKEIKNKQRAEKDIERQKNILSQRQILDQSVSQFVIELSKAEEKLSPEDFTNKVAARFQQEYLSLVELENGDRFTKQNISFFLNQNTDFLFQLNQLKKRQAVVASVEAHPIPQKSFFKRNLRSVLLLVSLGVMPVGNYLYQRFYLSKATEHYKEQSQKTADSQRLIEISRDWKNFKGRDAISFLEKTLENIHFHDFYETRELDNLFKDLGNEELEFYYEVYRFIGSIQYDYHLRLKMDTFKEQFESILNRIKTKPFISKEISKVLSHKLYVAMARAGIKFISPVEKGEHAYGFTQLSIAIDYLEQSQKFGAVDIKTLNSFVRALAYDHVGAKDIKRILALANIKNIKEDAEYYLEILFLMISNSSTNAALEMQTIFKNKLELLIEDMNKNNVKIRKYDKADFEYRFSRLKFLKWSLNLREPHLAKLYVHLSNSPLKEKFELNAEEAVVLKYLRSPLVTGNVDAEEKLFVDKASMAVFLVLAGYIEEGCSELLSIYFYLANAGNRLILKEVTYDPALTKSALQKFKEYLEKNGYKNNDINRVDDFIIIR